ncbi:MAG: hypothetical protein K8T91_23450 [Planctomycetes bacterium]|nr:hypothetical protein [Planctomycetota bacterium]
MEVLNKSFSALADRFRTMSAAARLMAGLLLIVAVTCVGLLASRQPKSADMLMLSGEAIAPDQLPRTEAAFAKAGLSDYQIEAGRIRIPRSRNAAYMAALAAADALPANFGDILDKPLRQANPLMSRSQQEEMIKVARQNALASIIQKMKGVERAAVLYDREKKPGLGGGERVTASVTVQMQDKLDIQPEQVESLRRLLSGAIAGLKPHDIAVIDLNSGRSFTIDSSADRAAQDRYTDSKRQLEQRWAAKLRDALQFISGLAISVDVELDPKSPQRPQTAAVSLGIPLSYVEQATGRQMPGKTPAASLATTQSEIIAKIESQVRTLLADQTGGAESQLKVLVSVYPDVAHVAEPALQDEAIAWARQNASTLGLSGLAAMSLLILGSIVRRRPIRAMATAPAINNPAYDDEPATSWVASASPASSPLSMAESPLHRTETEAELKRVSQPAVTPVKPFRADPQLRDQLAEIVRDDPHVAARVLRSWIGSTN